MNFEMQCILRYSRRIALHFQLFLLLLLLFFYLGFLSQTFTIHRTAEDGRGYFFKPTLPLPPAQQTLRHQPGNYCRELTSAHSQQLDWNRELLVSEHKLLTTKLHALLQLVRLTDLWLTFYKTRINRLNGEHLLPSAIQKKERETS